MAAQIEHGAIELRNLCARYQAPLPPVGQKPALEPLNIAGRAECNEFGWLHIQLNALLPNCRFASPLWITDTITRLLDRLERRNGKLPLLEEALLMIDEHCDIAARQVYDQDNKAWKAISNALKGRVVADDDQYSLGGMPAVQTLVGSGVPHLCAPCSGRGRLFLPALRPIPLFPLTSGYTGPHGGRTTSVTAAGKSPP